MLPTAMLTPKEDLTSTHQILHLTHHRNKNQHRLSKWYKSFSQLRRQIPKLITELEALEIAETYSTSGAKGKKKRVEKGENKYVLAAREKVELRVRFLREWVVGECFLAFSNLVADNQYSVLGLMLLGTLARVKSILGQLVDGDEVESTKNEGDALREEVEGDARGDDFGEVVSREEVFIEVEGSRHDLAEEGEDEVAEQGEEGEQDGQKTEETQQRTTAKLSKKKRIGPRIDRDGQLEKEESTPSKPPKKKRKKGDAFDDLFSSLI